VKVVARALRDAGMEVIYTGLWQSPERVVRAVADEDADALGISLLSGAHLTLMPTFCEMMQKEGLGDVPVIVGGIIPEEDVPPLEAAGVAKIFGPGAHLNDIVDFIQKRVRGPSVSPATAG
jgi:methylmalonyl-CoA mutase C-terminal domain/subunit